MLTLLVWLLVFCLVYWCATQLMSAFGVGDPIRTVIIVILVILAIYFLLGQLGIGLPQPAMTFWDLVAKSWRGFLDWLRMGGTSHVPNMLRGALYLAMLAKWIDLTSEQQIGVIGAVEMILQGIAAKTTVPTAKVEQKKDAAFAKGMAAGVAQSGTGDGVTGD